MTKYIQVFTYRQKITILRNITTEDKVSFQNICSKDTKLDNNAQHAEILLYKQEKLVNTK